MQDTIETYLNLDELQSKTLCDEVEDDNTLEPILNEVQLRYTQLRERLIALKAITETLKDQIINEKQLWYKELQETVAIERQLREKNKQESGDKFAVMSTEDYRTKLQMFKDFVLFTSATKNMENIVKKSNYKQWLYDVESKCNLELLKIKQSMTILKPLKAIASKWNDEEGIESGDHVSVKLEILPENNNELTTSEEVAIAEKIVEVEEDK